jgi:hypothetical protein
MKLTIIKSIAILLLFFGWVVAQDYEEFFLEGKELIDEGVNQWKQDQMLAARALFERMLETQNENDKWFAHYYVAYCDYRLADYFICKSQGLPLQFLPLRLVG